MDKNAERYYQSALRFLLPVNHVPEIEGFEIKLGKKRYFFRGSQTPCNNSMSVDIARNKYCMNQLLHQAGLPVPKATAIDITDFEQDAIAAAVADLSFPLVLKPLQGSKGQDVLCNIQTIEQLKYHASVLFREHHLLTIEEFHGDLNSYRVLVFKKKVIGVVLRYPAHVIGDGEHTLQELIELANIERAKINEILAPIVVDDEVQIRLNELGLTLSNVPQKDERIRLCYTCNSSRGGTFESVSKKICKKNRKLVIKAAGVLNLKLVGFDLVCTDINTPIADSAGVIIEANFRPSIRIHEESMIGRSVNVTKSIVRDFIYQHPLSYLYSLYTHERSRYYIRSILALSVLGSAYKLLIYANTLWN